jgi:hypothetical protein
MNYDEMDHYQFIDEMNNSDRYKGIFRLMVEGRKLFFRVQGMRENVAYSIVAGNLLQSQTHLSWNNEATRERIITYEARNIIHLLEGIGRFHPSEEAEEEADTLIISLDNAITNLYPSLDNNGRGFRKRKRKSIKTKSKKSKKSRKSRKSRN